MTIKVNTTKNPIIDNIKIRIIFHIAIPYFSSSSSVVKKIINSLKLITYHKKKSEIINIITATYTYLTTVETVYIYLAIIWPDNWSKNIF